MLRRNSPTIALLALALLIACRRADGIKAAYRLDSVGSLHAGNGRTLLCVDLALRGSFAPFSSTNFALLCNGGVTIPAAGLCVPQACDDVSSWVAETQALEPGRELKYAEAQSPTVIFELAVEQIGLCNRLAFRNEWQKALPQIEQK